MTRQVEWSERARADIRDQIVFIAIDDPAAADHVLHRIDATGNALRDFATGRLGRVEGTYEKSVRGLPYIIAYELVRDDVVSIVRVIHTARDWREGEWPT